VLSTPQQPPHAHRYADSPLLLLPLLLLPLLLLPLLLLLLLGGCPCLKLVFLNRP
jgi:hypothetical protein